MTVADSFLLIVRWLHITSAAAWVGGSLFYLLVLRPAIRKSQHPPHTLSKRLATEFNTLVNACIVILIATGVILGTQRLTEPVTNTPYVITLGVKSVLSVWMFLLVSSERRRTRMFSEIGISNRQSESRKSQLFYYLSGYNILVILGIMVFFLSDMLNVIFEISLSD